MRLPDSNTNGPYETVEVSDINHSSRETLEIADDWCPLTMAHYDEYMRNRKNRLAP